MWIELSARFMALEQGFAPFPEVFDPAPILVPPWHEEAVPVKVHGAIRLLLTRRRFFMPAAIHMIKVKRTPSVESMPDGLSAVARCRAQTV